MSKRTLFLIFALFVITFVLLVLALYKPSAPQTIQTVIAPKEAIEQTVLSFGSLSASASSSINQSALQTYSLPIDITTGKNKVTAVQLELQYDPKVLTNAAVAPGSFFKNPIMLLNQIDSKTGRVSYAFGIGLKDQGVAGKGEVAVITFDAKVGIPQQTAILFLPKTLVTAEGITASVLKQTNNIQIILGEKISTPSTQ